MYRIGGEGRVQMRRSERGANVVEMAIVLPLLLLLLAGVADLGRAFNTFIIVTNAAREGARIGARLPCYSDNAAQRAAVHTAIVNAVIAEAQNSGIALDGSMVTIIPDPASSCAGKGNPIRVLVDYDYRTLFVGLIGLDHIRLPGAATMVSFGNDQLP